MLHHIGSAPQTPNGVNIDSVKLERPWLLGAARAPGCLSWHWFPLTYSGLGLEVAVSEEEIRSPQIFVSSLPSFPSPPPPLLVLLFCF